MDYEYVIVTSIPVFKYKGVLFTDERWAEDINGQVGLWKKLNIVCPIKESKKFTRGICRTQYQYKIQNIHKF